MKCRGAGVERHGVPHSDIVCELALERRNLRPVSKPARTQGPRGRVDLGLTDARPAQRVSYSLGKSWSSKVR